MSAALINLAVILGLCCAGLSMFAGLSRDIPFWTVMFRSAIVMSISTVILIAFFRYFNVVLYQFLADKLEEHRVQEEELRQQEEAQASQGELEHVEIKQEGAES